jgi:4'-phosphopantetheinyl transferase
MSGAWMELRSPPALTEGEAHVWLAHLPTARKTLNELSTLLKSDELARSQQFRTDLLRERWQLTRAILRSLLAQYSGVHPLKITFQLGVHGKPALAAALGQAGLQFNTSHSGDYAALAFTRCGDIGVDIEQTRGEMRRHESIAQRFFTRSEIVQLESVPKSEQVQAFYSLWTRKEAFVKARGDGVASGLDQFTVSLTEPRILDITNGDASQWSLSVLPIIDGYAGAMVVKAPECRPRFWNWTASQLVATASS